ncbi:MAG TPA: MBL fold metallo-hydrolase [Paludibacter sp.]|nr:MBL fold metallo-hydrolase [Paludibacter sp.]HOS45074.1 MBL fold metallo-hydrolase [Paludibacter sp.]HPM08927.1 MBL fold metallo-hydrolase [Paludibacter sp.]
MTIKLFTFNPVQVNTYVLHDETGEAIVIDAGCFNTQEKRLLQSYIDDNRLKLVRVLNTHLHFDHQFGNKFLFDAYGLKPEAHRADEFLLEYVKTGNVVYGFPFSENAQPLGAYLQEDQLIKFGNTVLKTIHVPGHSPGHVVFYNEKEKVLFAGDVLFNGSIGRTDLEQGDYATLIRNIQEKLMTLPDDTIVYPGHGPSTSIGEERKYNPFL